MGTIPLLELCTAHQDRAEGEVAPISECRYLRTECRPARGNQ